MKRWLLTLFLILVSVSANAGFTAGVYGANDATGWATFTAKTNTAGGGTSCSAHTSNGTCALYFDTSSSGASCALTDVGDLTHLCKTIAQGMNTYGGRNGNPDWWLFRQGQTWNDGDCFSDDGTCTNTFTKSGLSDTDLLVISSYDPAQPTVVNPATGVARPIIDIQGTVHHGLVCQGGVPCKHFATVGLEVNAIDCDPRITGRATNLCSNMAFLEGQVPTPGFWYMEDMKLTNFNINFGPQGTATTESFTVRRSQLLNASVDNLDGGTGAANTFLFEENIVHGGTNVQQRYTGATISNANPAVISVANGMQLNGTSLVYFDSSGGGITAGFTNTYTAVDNNFSTFRISNSVFSQSSGSTNSSNIISVPSTSGMTVGDGVNCATCGSTTSSPCTITGGIVTDTQFTMSCTATDSAAHTITTFHQSSLRTGVGATTPQTVTFWHKQPDAFDHNVYWAENNTVTNAFYGKLNYRGNISSYDGLGSTQGRPGGNFENNAFIRNEIGHNFGSFVNQASTITENVHLSGQSWGGGPVSPFVTLGSTSYNGNPSGLGTFSVTNNIVANAIDATSQPIAFADGFTVTYGNNITYNWNSSTQFSGTGGGIKTAHVTSGGSGFTDNSYDVTAIAVNPFAGNGVDLTVTQDMTIVFGPDIYASFWVTGLTGGSCNVNNTLYYGQIQSAHTLFLYSPASVTGCSVVGAVKVYYAGFSTFPAITGCSGGSSGTTQVISVGGAAVALSLFGREGGLPQAGQGYTAGCTTAGLSIGSGAVITIDTVSTLTNSGGNAFDPTGGTPGAYPGCPASRGGSKSPNNCTPAKYYDFVTGVAGNTDLDFLTAAMNNYKGNWNPLLTANRGLNLWIKAGFGRGQSFDTTNP